MLTPHWTKTGAPTGPVYSSMSVATSLSIVVRSSVLVAADLKWYQIAALFRLSVVVAVPRAIGRDDVLELDAVDVRQRRRR